MACVCPMYVGYMMLTPFRALIFTGFTFWGFFRFDLSCIIPWGRWERYQGVVSNIPWCADHNEAIIVQFTEWYTLPFDWLDFWQCNGHGRRMLKDRYHGKMHQIPPPFWCHYCLEKSTCSKVWMGCVHNKTPFNQGHIYFGKGTLHRSSLTITTSNLSGQWTQGQEQIYTILAKHSHTTFPVCESLCAVEGASQFVYCKRVGKTDKLLDDTSLTDVSSYKRHKHCCKSVSMWEFTVFHSCSEFHTAE